MIYRELLSNIQIKTSDEEAIKWATEIIKSVYSGTGISAEELIEHFCLLVHFRKTGRIPIVQDGVLKEGQ